MRLPPRDPHRPLPALEHLPGCAYDHNKPDESTGSCVPDCPIGGLETCKRLIEEGMNPEAVNAMQRSECGHVGSTRDGKYTAVCSQPKGHAGKHGGMGCEW